MESRSQAVRTALEALIDRHRREHTGREIVEGYRRRPQDADLEAWAIRSGEAMVEAEPW